MFLIYMYEYIYFSYICEKEQVKQAENCLTCDLDLFCDFEILRVIIDPKKCLLNGCKFRAILGNLWSYLADGVSSFKVWDFNLNVYLNLKLIFDLDLW